LIKLQTFIDVNFTFEILNEISSPIQGLLLKSFMAMVLRWWLN